jgi:hypothetical protein
MTHVDAAIHTSIEKASHSVRSDYEKAVQSPQKGNLYTQVLLACALAQTTEMGFFTAASVREPLQKITDRDIDIPNYAQHLNNFSTAERGEILEKLGKKHRFQFRFRNPLDAALCGDAWLSGQNDRSAYATSVRQNPGLTSTCAEPPSLRSHFASPRAGASLVPCLPCRQPGAGLQLPRSLGAVGNLGPLRWQDPQRAWRAGQDLVGVEVSSRTQHRHSNVSESSESA